VNDDDLVLCAPPESGVHGVSWEDFSFNRRTRVCEADGIGETSCKTDHDMNAPQVPGRCAPINRGAPNTGAD